MRNIRANWPILTVALSALCVVGLSLAQGCDLRNLVSFDPPAGVRTALAMPDGERVTLADSEKVMADWSAFVERETAALAHDLDESNRNFAAISSVIQLGWTALEGQAATVPGGAIITTALGTLGALFLRAPGTRRKEQTAMRSEYQRGRADKAAESSPDTNA
jgi:hypothetical protein